MPELDFLTVRGFRSLAHLERVRLGAVNVLIGANGSGKSNFISVFALLRALGERNLDEFVARAGGANRMLHFGSKQTECIELEVSFRRPTRSYSAKIKPTVEDELFVAEEGAAGLEPENGAKGVKAWVANQLDSWRIYHFQDTSEHSLLKKTSKLHDNRYLRADGSNLAAVLYLLRERHETSYQRIRKTIQRVAPFFDDFALEPLALNPDTIQLEWRHRGSDAYWDAGSLSDGTLRFMALATLLLQPVEMRPSVILVDEPEIGLHPYAITMLAGLIKQASVDTQVIVSTQSSLLLDHFEPDDVLVAERDGGATTLRRLDAESLEEWLEDYSLGQLWEKNELGGRPNAA